MARKRAREAEAAPGDTTLLLRAANLNHIKELMGRAFDVPNGLWEGFDDGGFTRGRVTHHVSSSRTAVRARLGPRSSLSDSCTCSPARGQQPAVGELPCARNASSSRSAASTASPTGSSETSLPTYEYLS